VDLTKLSEPLVSSVLRLDEVPARVSEDALCTFFLHWLRANEKANKSSSSSSSSSSSASTKQSSLIDLVRLPYLTSATLTNLVKVLLFPFLLFVF
jgi:hypothetical protein